MCTHACVKNCNKIDLQMKYCRDFVYTAVAGSRLLLLINVIVMTRMLPVT